MPFEYDTSKVTNFEPYIETTPIRTIESAAYNRQQQYNQGLQIIAQQYQQQKDLGSYFENPQFKEYLNTKLSKAQNQLAGAISGDLSNLGLVTALGGAIKSISNDNIIQTGLIDASTIRANKEQLEKDKKDGKYSPANEFVFQQGVNQYRTKNLQDSEGNIARYNGEYSTYFDRMKYAKEVFDAVKPGKLSWDEAFTKGKNGQLEFAPTLQRHIREGRDMSDVMNTLNEIFSDARYQKQLGIDGIYEYRNYDVNATLPNGEKPFKTALINIINQKKDADKVIYNNQLLELNTKKSLGQDVQKQEDAVIAQIKNINTKYDNLINGLESNPDAVKSQLFATDEYQRLSKMFYNESKEDQVLSNPGAHYMLEVQQERNKIQMHQNSLNQEWSKFTITEARLNREAKQKQENWVREQINSKKIPNDMSPNTWDYTRKEPISELAHVMSVINNAATELQMSSDELIFATALNTPHNWEIINNSSDRAKTMNMLIENTAIANKENPKSFRDRFLNKALVEYNKIPKNNIDKSLMSIKNRYDNATTNWDATAEARKITEPLFSDVKFNTIEKYTSPSSGKTFSVDKGDMQLLAAVIKGENTTIFAASDEDLNMAKEAREELRKRGKLSLIEDAINSNLHVDAAEQLGNQGYSTIAAITETIAIPFKSPIRRGVLAPLFPNYNEKIENDQKYVQKAIGGLSEFVKKLQDVNPKTISERFKKAGYMVNPNVGGSLFTGNAEHNRGVRESLGALAAKYEGDNNPLNLASKSDFDNFKTNIFDDKYHPVLTIQDGNVIVDLRDAKNNNAGYMYMSPEDAKNRGIDIDNIYTSNQNLNLQNYINQNNGKSWKGFANPTDKNTYYQNNSLFKKSSFNGIEKEDNYDAQLNYKQVNGAYYPYLYLSRTDPKTKKVEDHVFSLNPSTSFGENVDGYKMIVTPTYIDQMLSTVNK